MFVLISVSIILALLVMPKAKKITKVIYED
jgi:hypothetical protein